MGERGRRFVADVAAAGKGGVGVAAVEEARDGCEGVFASLPAQMGGGAPRPHQRTVVDCRCDRILGEVGPAMKVVLLSVG